MSNTEYTQGICEDGAAILRDGQPMTVEEILDALRNSEQLKAEVEQLQAESKRRQRLYIECETDNTSLINERQKLKRQSKRLKAQINGMKQALDELVRNSEGVAGLHQNGDIAPWDELLTGGRFEEWLSVLDDTPQQCLVSRDAEVVRAFVAAVKQGDAKDVEGGYMWDVNDVAEFSEEYIADQLYKEGGE